VHGNLTPFNSLLPSSKTVSESTTVSELNEAPPYGNLRGR